MSEKINIKTGLPKAGRLRPTAGRAGKHGKFGKDQRRHERRSQKQKGYENA